MTGQSLAAELAEVKDEVRVLRAMLVEIGIFTPAHTSLMDRSIADRRKHGVGREDIDLLPDDEAAILLRAFVDLGRARAKRSGGQKAA